MMNLVFIHRYRSRVDVVNMDGSVKVTYVDYGNSEELSSTDLRKLDSQFKEIPITVRLKSMEYYNVV